MSPATAEALAYVAGELRLLARCDIREMSAEWHLWASEILEQARNEGLEGVLRLGDLARELLVAREARKAVEREKTLADHEHASCSMLAERLVSVEKQRERYREALERIQSIGEDVYDAITPPHEIATKALFGGKS